MDLSRLRNSLTGGRQRAGEPPLVRSPVPYLGHALAMGQNALELMRQCQRQHGDIFTLLVAGRRMTFVLDPFSYPAVLKIREDLDFHQIAAEYGRRAFGYSLPSNPHDAETMQELSAKFLLGPAQKTLTERTGECVRRAIDRVLQKGTGQDELFSLVARIIFSATTETFFGDGIHELASLADYRFLDRYFPLLVGGFPCG